MLTIKRDINQQDFKIVDLHFPSFTTVLNMLTIKRGINQYNFWVVDIHLVKSEEVPSLVGENSK